MTQVVCFVYVKTLCVVLATQLFLHNNSRIIFSLVLITPTRLQPAAEISRE